MLLGWITALIGSLAYGAGSVLQGWAATRAAGPAVIKHPAYVAGLGCDALAWSASLVAFRLLPLLVVQAVLTGSVAVTVILARLLLGTRLRGRDVAAIVVLSGALVGLAAAFGSIGSSRTPAGTTAWTLLGLAIVAVVLAVGYRAATSVSLAVVAGAAFSGASVAVRALHVTSVVALALQPLAWAIIGFALVGSLAYARSLERGPVGPATAVLWSVETILAGLAGLAVFGDQVRGGQGWAAALEVLLILLSCAVLASGAARTSTVPSPLTPGWRAPRG
jgi:hypothetical protein